MSRHMLQSHEPALHSAHTSLNFTAIHSERNGSDRESPFMHMTGSANYARLQPEVGPLVRWRPFSCELSRGGGKKRGLRRSHHNARVAAREYASGREKRAETVFRQRLRLSSPEHPAATKLGNQAEPATTKMRRRRRRWK